MYRDILIDCNVIPALLARIRPDTPVRFDLENVVRKTAESLPPGINVFFKSREGLLSLNEET